MNPTEPTFESRSPKMDILPIRKRSPTTFNKMPQQDNNIQQHETSNDCLKNKQNTTEQHVIAPPMMNLNTLSSSEINKTHTNPQEKEIILGQGECCFPLDKDGTSNTVRTVETNEQSGNRSQDNEVAVNSIFRSSINIPTTTIVYSSTPSSISNTALKSHRVSSSPHIHVPQYITPPTQTHLVRKSSFEVNNPIFNNLQPTQTLPNNNQTYYVTGPQFLSTTNIPTIQYSPSFCTPMHTNNQHNIRLPVSPNTSYSHAPLFVSTQPSPSSLIPTLNQPTANIPSIPGKTVKRVKPSSPVASVASSSSSSSHSSQYLQIVSQEYNQDRKRSISPVFDENSKCPPEKKSKSNVSEGLKSLGNFKIPKSTEETRSTPHTKESLRGKKTIVARFLCPNNCEIQGTPIVSLDSMNHSIKISGVTLVYNPPEFSQIEKTIVMRGEDGSLEIRVPLGE